MRYRASGTSCLSSNRFHAPQGRGTDDHDTNTYYIYTHNELCLHYTESCLPRRILVLSYAQVDFVDQGGWNLVQVWGVRCP